LKISQYLAKFEAKAHHLNVTYEDASIPTHCLFGHVSTVTECFLSSKIQCLKGNEFGTKWTID